jgi:hypothetical protein
MEFSDIDPSHFLDQLNWDEQEDDNERGRSESAGKEGDFSCEMKREYDNDDGRVQYPWDMLLMDDGGSAREEEKSIGKDREGGNASNRPQDGDGHSFPQMASYESLMADGPSHSGQPQLLTHPLAMTSLSSCPSFPLSGSSISGNNTHTNATVAADSMNEEAANSHRMYSSIPQPSVVTGTESSQTSGSNNDSSATSNNLFNTHHPMLPSWNDSMGDLMYSPLFNIGIPNTTNNNRDGTSASPFQCTPLNSAFGTNLQQSSMIHSHYGMAINGFHPQVNAIVNPVLPLNGTAAHGTVPRAGTTSPGTVKTSNAGKSATGNVAILSMYSTQNPQQPAPQPSLQGKPESKQQKQKDKKAANERNEREQMRAKKITQLIHEIKSNMEAEGWKEEMKSKYETLSQ